MYALSGPKKPTEFEFGSKEEAAYRLSLMYFNGSDGVRADRTEGMRLCLLAAQGGFPKAQGEYAIRQFELGDAPTGVYWLKLSAEAGEPDAQLVLGAKYIEGAGGLPRDLDMAEHWFRLADAQGSPQAKECLAVVAKGREKQKQGI